MKTEKDGVYVGMDRETYDRSSRVNFSTLKLIDESPAHYRHQLLKKPNKDTKSKKVGRGTHLAVFEPEQFREACAVWDGERRAGKEWEAFKAANEGRELLKVEEHEECLAMQAAARANKDAAPYLAGGVGELTVFWTRVSPPLGALPGYSVKCKSRIDFVADCGALVDLKTCRSARPDKFERQAWDLKYHAQAAFYVDAYKAATGRELPYVIVAIENHGAYVAQVYTVPEFRLAQGREIYRGWLDRLDLCRRTSSWPGYAPGPLELPLPRWAAPDDGAEDLTGLDIEFNAANQE
jgi:hypothetical protein